MPELGTSASGQEICDDFVDNDGDNLIDTDDIQDCPLSSEGVAANGTETPTPTLTTPAQGSNNLTSQVNGSDTTPFPEIVFVIVCNDGSPANNDGSCTDGSQPLTVSTEELNAMMATTLMQMSHVLMVPTKVCIINSMECIWCSIICISISISNNYNTSISVSSIFSTSNRYLQSLICYFG